MSSLLEVDSVFKSFDERQVLTDIYLQCQTGDIVGLLGRNGCGKTTLMQTIFGTLLAEKFIRIDGRVHSHPYKIPDQICYLPQHEFLPRHMTVQKAVQLYLGSSEIAGFFDDELLRPIINSKIYLISGGEQRYLEIKLLLSTKSKFVLLDEQFNGLAPIMIESIKALIKNRSRSKGIILTDHDYRNVLDVADRSYILYDGGLKLISVKDDLVKWAYLSESA